MVKERVDAVLGREQKRAEADRKRQLYGLSLEDRGSMRIL
jgi:hypothetical protein